jgi:hypothetical protein
MGFYPSPSVLWQRIHPRQTHTIQADLDGLRQQVLYACTALDLLVRHPRVNVLDDKRQPVVQRTSDRLTRLTAPRDEDLHVSSLQAGRSTARMRELAQLPRDALSSLIIMALRTTRVYGRGRLWSLVPRRAGRSVRTFSTSFERVGR